MFISMVMENLPEPSLLMEVLLSDLRQPLVERAAAPARAVAVILRIMG
jgi:hypothetical protein